MTESKGIASNRPGWREYAALSLVSKAINDLDRFGYITGKTTEAMRRLMGKCLDHSREGMFVLHDCWRCQDGTTPCIRGNPRQCEYPHARND
jgi:hypothetical protein